MTQTPQDIAERTADAAAAGRDPDAVTYRPMRWDDLEAVVREFDRTWGGVGAPAGSEVSLLLSRHFTLHYLEPATRGEVAESADGRLLGVTLARVVGAEPAFPQAGEELRRVDGILRSLPDGRGPLDDTLRWHRLEEDMEDDAAINGRTQGELELFLVAAAARGRGVGGGLWRRFLDYLAREGVSRYYLHTDSSCDVGFYRHQGLACVAERLAADHPEDDRTDGTAMDDIFLYEGAVPSRAGGNLTEDTGRSHAQEGQA